ncbi:Sad1-UNC-like carboxy terminal protein [Schizosaccharomyces japonicus yFS275]|uniref:SUN-like protein 1 n=1 Tax=Schizosaccharomyces japonicus (strain yFS275 / FY16936) TaxID=402676 RepID=B6JZJ2_SCHJY|nr:Sad1-UNC-like carboxy terminal protein [Schizosaccharomyces japonicus yFS275]EEB06960.1 Sad1-UNC-like carboxy terminal protein [Schizosaccharomyces japonicus yFS275]
MQLASTNFCLVRLQNSMLFCRKLWILAVFLTLHLCRSQTICSKTKISPFNEQDDSISCEAIPYSSLQSIFQITATVNNSTGTLASALTRETRTGALLSEAVNESIQNTTLSTTSPTLGESETIGTHSTETVNSSSSSEKSTAASPVPTKEAKRFNFASTDCAAAILEANAEAKMPSAILSENRDKYMLIKCSVEPKFMVIELCDDISIDTIQLANYEFFSSTFRDVKFSVSSTYPPKGSGWTDLGTFTARNVRTLQSFQVDYPKIWAKYLKVEFLDHYGSEFYCPVSIIRVYGKTMLDEFREERKADDDVLDSTEKEQAEAGAAEDGSAVSSDASHPNATMQTNGSKRAASTGTDMNSAAEGSESKNDGMNQSVGTPQSQISHVTNAHEEALTATQSEHSSVLSGKPTLVNQNVHATNQQESIYRNMYKRLSVLEEKTNQLKAQLANLEKLTVSHFQESNSTLIRVRDEYISLLEVSLSIIHAKQELYDAEGESLTKRVNMLAQDYLLQKRLLVLQSLLLISIIVILSFWKSPFVDRFFRRVSRARHGNSSTTWSPFSDRAAASVEPETPVDEIVGSSSPTFLKRFRNRKVESVLYLDTQQNSLSSNARSSSTEQVSVSGPPKLHARSYTVA